MSSVENKASDSTDHNFLPRLHDLFFYSLSTMECQSDAIILYRVIKLKGRTQVLLQREGDSNYDKQLVARIPKYQPSAFQHMSLILPKKRGLVHMYSRSD